MNVSIKSKSLEQCELCASVLSKSLTPFDKNIHYAVRKCLVCKSEWIDPMPDLGTLNNYYSDYIHSNASWDQFLTLVEWARAKAETIIAFHHSYSLVKDSGDLTFLDIGGASGFLSVAMAELGFNAVSQDIDPSAGTWLSTMNSKHELQVERFEGSLEHILESRKVFTVINASQVMEHLRNPKELIMGVKRILKPGGLLFVDVPNNDAALWCFKNPIRPIFNRMHFYNALQPPQHLWGYTKAGLHKLLEQCGYEILELTDYGLGDERFQPASKQWYIDFKQLLANLSQNQIPSFYVFAKIVLTMFDRKIFSPILRSGGGLAAVCRYS